MATQGDAMRHLVHSVICGLIAMVVTVSGAYADQDSTYRHLLTYYQDALDSQQGYEIRDSSVALPQCSGILETVVTLSTVGADWVNFFFPDAGGDPAGIDEDMAAEFCVYVLGLHDEMTDPCPYHDENACLPYATADAGAGMDAAVGCMMFLRDFNENEMGLDGIAQVIMSEILDYGGDIVGTTQDYICNGQSTGAAAGDFWAPLPSGTLPTPRRGSLDSCQRVDVVMHIMSRMGAVIDGMWDSVIVMDMEALAQAVAEPICWESEVLSELFGMQSTCEKIVRGVVGRYWLCWADRFDPTQMRELYQCRYADDKTCAYDIITRVIDRCSQDGYTTYCPSGITVSPVDCSEEEWGNFVCQACGSPGRISSHAKAFIDECDYTTNSGTGFDYTGEYVDEAVECVFEFYPMITADGD